jgi:hypothetical protein
MLQTPVWLVLALVVPQGADKGCLRCDHHGMEACENHIELERAGVLCSIAAACELCGGSLLVDCRYCTGGPDTAVDLEKRAAILAWLEETPLEKHFGRDLPRVETEHFELVIDTGELREGKKKVDAHTLSHRVADDVERVAELMAEHLQVKQGDYHSKMRMWIWKSVEDHGTAMAKFLGSTGTGDFKILGGKPVFSVWTEKPHFDEVPEVRSLFAHNAAHMLLSDVIHPMWFGDVGGGWFDAAVGHWYEYAIFERTSNYCIEEATLSGNYANGLWRAAIRSRLRKETEPLLPGLLAQNIGAMRQSDQALCWSFYDFLVAEHPQALRPIVADLKKRRPAREIFTERLGMSVIEADAAWREWVPTVYPTKGDEPKQPKKKKGRG